MPRISRHQIELSEEERVELERLQAATIAVVGQVPMDRLVHAIAPFPARSELWLKFIEAYGR